MQSRPGIVRALLALTGALIGSSTFDADEGLDARSDVRVAEIRSLLADIASPGAAPLDLPDGVRAIVERTEKEV